MKPYYEDDYCTIYHGDCREVDAWLEADVLVTDPPYGDKYRSGSMRRTRLARSVQGDESTAVRDEALEQWTGPALVFGKWRPPRPEGTRMVLVWDKGGALGMGDLSLPWKPDHEEVYVIGSGFAGTRDCGSVLRFPPVQSVGREHPNEKPVELMAALLAKTVGVVADPFMGTGPVLRAAKNVGRRAIGVEVEERYCEIAAKRLAQEVLDFGGAA